MASLSEISSESVSISRCTCEDAARIATLGESTFWQSHGHSASKSDIKAYVSRAFNLETVKTELINPKYYFFILSLSGIDVGFSKLAMDMPIEHIPNPALCKLERLYIDQSYYGKGLGLALFEHALEQANIHDQSGMWLYVWTENKRAVNFYTRQGFSPVGKYDFVLSADHSNPNHQMYLSLENRADD